MPTTEFDFLISKENNDVIEYQNTILKAFQDKYGKCLVYVQDRDNFIYNVVNEDEGLLGKKIKTKNEYLEFNDFHSTKNNPTKRTALRIIIRKTL